MPNSRLVGSQKGNSPPNLRNDGSNGSAGLPDGARSPDLSADSGDRTHGRPERRRQLLDPTIQSDAILLKLGADTISVRAPIASPPKGVLALRHPTLQNVGEGFHEGQGRPGSLDGIGARSADDSAFRLNLLNTDTGLGLSHASELRLRQIEHPALAWQQRSRQR